MSISFRCGDFVVVWKKFWNDNYLFEVELFQHFLQLKNLLRATRKTFAGRMLCGHALEQWFLTFSSSRPPKVILPWLTPPLL